MTCSDDGSWAIVQRDGRWIIIKTPGNETFETDADALQWVRTCAKLGSESHAFAMEIINDTTDY